MFSDSAFAPLKIKRVRYNVNWDWNRLQVTRDDLDAFLTQARAQASTSSSLRRLRRLLERQALLQGEALQAPSASKYARSVRTLRKQSLS